MKRRDVCISILIAISSILFSLYVLPYTDVRSDAVKYIPDCSDRGSASPWIDRALYQAYCSGFKYVPSPYTEFVNSLPIGGAFVEWIVAWLTNDSKVLEVATYTLFSIPTAYVAYRVVRGWDWRRKLVPPGLLSLIFFGVYSSDIVGVAMYLSGKKILRLLSLLFSPFLLPLYLMNVVVERRAEYAIAIALTSLIFVATGFWGTTTPFCPIFRYFSHPYCEYCIYQLFAFKSFTSTLNIFFANLCYSIVVIMVLLGIREAILAIPILGVSAPPQVYVTLPVYLYESRIHEGITRYDTVLLIVSELANLGIIMTFFRFQNPLSLTSVPYALSMVRSLLLLFVVYRHVRSRVSLWIEYVKRKEIEQIMYKR